MPFTRDEIVNMAKSCLTGQGISIEGMTDEDIVRSAGFHLPVEEAKPVEKGGAAAFIAGIEKAVADVDADRRAYVNARVAKMEAFMRAMMAEANADPLHHTIVDDAAQRQGLFTYDKDLALFEDAAGIAGRALANIYGNNSRSIPAICVWAQHIGEVFWQYAMIASGHAERP